MNMIKGWGFVNEDLEILCIKTDESDNKYLQLVPWRQASPSEVIIMWDPSLSNLKSILCNPPFNDILNLEAASINIDSLEAIHVEKDDKTIWIG